MHTKSPNWRLYASHGRDEWYVGPSLFHYRCYKYIVSLTGLLHADTVKIPTSVPFPKANIDTYLCQAATAMLTI